MKIKNLAFIVGIMFLFFVSITQVYALYTDNGSLAQNVNDCGTLNTTNAVYTLNQDVFSNSSCFTIAANNISFDGASHTVNYSMDGSGGNAIDVTGYNLTTIHDVTLLEYNLSTSNAHGISISNGNNETITNLTVISNSTSNWNYGIYIDTSKYDFISNATFVIDSKVSSAIRLAVSTNYSIFSNINVNAFKQDTTGFLIGSNSNYNLFTNMTIYASGNQAEGISMQLSNFNTFSNFNLNLATGTIDAISLGFTSHNNNFTNINATFTNGNSITDGLFISQADGSIFTNITVNITGTGNDLQFDDTANAYLVNPLFSTDNGSAILDTTSSVQTNYLVFNNSYGEIRFTNTSFLKNLTTNGNITPQTIWILNNSVFVNSTYFAGQRINSSADIKFYGMSANFTSPNIVRDGTNVCNSGTTPACYNSTSLNASTVKFNVSSWSNYSILDSTIYISSCQNLNQANTRYILQNNVSATVTCFTIGANNVTLDGAGYTINYSTSGSVGYGVYDSGYNYLTVKNLSVVEGKVSGFFKYAIDMYNSTNSSLSNLSISTIGVGSSGIYLDTCQNDVVSNINVITNNSIADGVLLLSSSNISVSNLIFSANGNSAVGVHLESSTNNGVSAINASVLGTGSSGALLDTSNNNVISNSSLYTSVGISDSLYLGSSSNNIISNVNVSTMSSNSNGVSLSSSTNNTFSNMTVLTVGSSSVGVYLSQSSNNTFYNNTINSTNASDISLASTTSDGCNNNFDSSNIISGKALNYSVGANNLVLNSVNNSIYGQYIIASATNVTIKNNNFSKNGITFCNVSGSSISNTQISSLGDSIDLSFSTNNNLYNLNLSSSASSSKNIFASQSANNLFSNTSILSTGTGSYGSYLASSTNNTLSNISILTTNSNAYGVYLTSSSNNSVLKLAITTIGLNSVGTLLSLSMNNSLTNITVFTNGSSAHGLQLSGSHNNTLSFVILSTNGSSAFGAYLTQSSDNLFSNINISTIGSSSSGLNFNPSPINCSKNVFSNINILTTGAAAYGIIIPAMYSSLGTSNYPPNLTTIINPSITTNSNSINDLSGNSYTNYLIFNNSYGQITWTNTANGGFLKNLTLIENISSQTISITNDSVFVNSTYFAGEKINSSANIILYGLQTNFVSPYISRDGSTTACSSGTTPACYNFTDLNAGTVQFNVSSWSNYSILGDTSGITHLSSCQVLNTENASYVLTQSVSSTGTCFNITANNITLDGAGYIVNYSTNSTLGYGVYISNYNRSTIKNLNIFEGNATTFSKHGLYLLSSSNTIISNVNISTIGAFSYGTYLSANSNYNILSNVNISANNSGAIGMEWDSSSNNNLSNTTISQIGSSAANAHGMFLSLSSNNILSNITISAIAAASGSGVVLSSSSNNIISNANISANSGRGIYFSSNSNNNVLSNTTLFTTGTGISNGISLSLSTNNTFYNNTVNSTNTSDVALNTGAVGGCNNYFDASNIVSGKPLNYSVGANNVAYTGLNSSIYGQLIIASATNVTLSNSNFTKNSVILCNLSGSSVRNLQVNSVDSSFVLYNVSSVNFTNLNLTTNSSSAIGFLAVSSPNNVVLNATISTNGFGSFGISTSASSNNTFSNLTIVTTGPNTYGAIFTSSSNNNISNVSISTTGTSSPGVYVSNCLNYILSGVSISTTGSSSRGLFLQTSSNNQFYNFNISTKGPSNANGAYLVTSSNGNILSNITIATTDSTGVGIFITSFSDQTQIINPNITTNSSAISDITGNSYTNYLIFNNSYGQITWTNTTDGGFLKNINVVQANLSLNDKYIQIKNNSVFLNSTYYSGGLINSSANITLYGLPTNISNPQIYRDGAFVCNSSSTPACYNFTNLNAGTVQFNVSSWSNYSILPGADMTPPLLLNYSTNHLTNESVHINTTTDEISNATLSFGTTKSLGTNLINSTNGTNHEFALTNLLNGTLYYYNITFADQFGNYATYGPYNFTTNATYTITVIINESNWLLNETTNFSQYQASQVLQLQNVTFANNYGTIQYLQNITLTQTEDVRNYIDVKSALLFVNSTVIPEFNRSAILTFNNVTILHPIVKRDNADCSGVYCSNNSFNSTTQIYTVQVTGFSTYNIAEQCSDGVQNYDETGLDCGGANCGACPSAPHGPSGGGGGGGGGGAGGIVPFTPATNLTNASGNNSLNNSSNVSQIVELVNATTKSSATNSTKDNSSQTPQTVYPLANKSMPWFQSLIPMLLALLIISGLICASIFYNSKHREEKSRHLLFSSIDSFEHHREWKKHFKK